MGVGCTSPGGKMTGVNCVAILWGRHVRPSASRCMLSRMLLHHHCSCQAHISEMMCTLRHCESANSSCAHMHAMLHACTVHQPSYIPAMHAALPGVSCAEMRHSRPIDIGDAFDVPVRVVDAHSIHGHG